jgi:hypothetical protein
MMNGAFTGLIAGATGTAVFNIVTYMDMALRSRSSREAPSRMVSILVDKVGPSLSSQGKGSQDHDRPLEIPGTYL